MQETNGSATADWIADKAEERWEHAGLECATVRNPFGGLNAYVRLPEPHRSRKFSTDDISYEEVDVSGGLTYGMDAAGWVGWDTLHSFDQWHDPEEIVETMRDHLTAHGPGGQTWTPERVRAENERLAVQLAAWCVRHPDAAGKFSAAEKLARSRAQMADFHRLTSVEGVPFDEAAERVFGGDD